MATTAEDKTGDRKVYRDHNLHVLFGVTLMAVLGVSRITPVLPEVRDAFGVTSGQVGFLISVFTLPGIALTPVLGVLSDRHGRRKILVQALLLFGALPEMDLTVEEAILDRFRKQKGDWRTWNLSRSRARHLAENYADSNPSRARVGPRAKG